MADPVVHITAGIPDSGTGNITTLGQTIAAQGGTLAGQQGPLVQGSASTSPPAYTTGTINPLSLDGSGNLRVLVGNASVAVTGTITANQGGAPWAQNVSQFGGSAVVTGTGIGGAGIPRVTVSSDSSLAATQSGTWNITNISGTVSLPTGAATAAKQPALGTAGAPSADVISVQGIAGGTAQPVSIAAAVTVVQPTAANLNATVSGTVAVSGTSAVKPDGTVWTLTGSSANVNVTGGSVSASQTGNWTSRIVGNLGAVLDAVQNAAAPPNELVVGGVYNSVAPTLTSGNASQLQLDSSGNLNVNIKAGAGSGGTASSFGATFPATGTAAGAEYLSSPPTLTTGQMVALQTDVNGNLKVNIQAGAGSGGTASSVGGATPGQGTLAMGAVTTAAPSYTTATANALSLDTSGNLRTSVTNTVAVTGTFWQTTQPVSGTVTVTQATAANLNATVTGSVSITGTPTISGTVTANQGGAPWTVKPDGTAWAMTSTSANVNVTNASIAVTGTFWQSTQPISAASLPLPSGAATAANQTAIQGVIGAAAAPANMEVVGGVFNSTKPTLTTGQSAALQSNSSGILLVDGSSVTQPVSGTVNIGSTVSCIQSGTWNVNSIQSGNWSIRMQDGAGSPITSHTVGSSHGLDVTLLDGSGNQLGVSGSPIRVDPTGTTTQPVSIAAAVSVNPGTAANWGISSSTYNSALPANDVLVAGEYISTQAVMTSGNSSPLQMDKVGRVLAVAALRTTKGRQKTSITTNTATTVVTAGAAGVFNDVYAIVVTNKSATSVTVDFSDGSGTVMTLAAPAGDTRGFTVPVDSAIPQSAAATAWTATVSAAVTSIEVTMLYAANL